MITVFPKGLPVVAFSDCIAVPFVRQSAAASSESYPPLFHPPPKMDVIGGNGVIEHPQAIAFLGFKE
jgi:hypothetical protein